MVISIPGDGAHPQEWKISLPGKDDGRKFRLPLVDPDPEGSKTRLIKRNALLKIRYEYSNMVKHVQLSR